MSSSERGPGFVVLVDSLEDVVTGMYIAKGLEGMDDDDFHCLTNPDVARKRESALAFCWAYKLRQICREVLPHYTGHVGDGVEDYYISATDTGVVVMLNAVSRAPDSSGARPARDIDVQLERCRDIKTYDFSKHFVFLNFAMQGDGVVLPSDASAHSKVYTFLRSSNTLYRGSTPVKTPAIPRLTDKLKPLK